MSLEIRAGIGWKHLNISNASFLDEDGVACHDDTPCQFEPANGLKIGPTNGHRKGLYGPNGLYILMSDSIDRGYHLSEVIFVDQPRPRRLNLPDNEWYVRLLSLAKKWLFGKESIRSRTIPSNTFDPQYPSNSLVVRLTEGEWVGLGKEGKPDYLNIIKQKDE